VLELLGLHFTMALQQLHIQLLICLKVNLICFSCNVHPVNRMSIKSKGTYSIHDVHYTCFDPFLKFLIVSCDFHQVHEAFSGNNILNISLLELKGIETSVCFLTGFAADVQNFINICSFGLWSIKFINKCG
jgi:hypothetical protein